MVKSLLSEDETTVYVDLSMPSSADVSFTLVSETGDKMHKWSNQTLTQGRHQIALPLIAQGKYQLLINVNNQQYEQLVYKSRWWLFYKRVNQQTDEGDDTINGKYRPAKF